MKITHEETKDALMRSGYLLESRTETVLLGQDFSVEANGAYVDPFTKKSREVDLIGMKFHLFGAREKRDSVGTVLIIECINNSQPVAFFTKEYAKAGSRLSNSNITISGSPLELVDPAEYLSDVLQLNTFHHYFKGRFATQYCSFQKKKSEKEWMAFHSEDNHDAFNSAINAMNHYVELETDLHQSSSVDVIDLSFYFPVVVFQGELLEVIPDKGSVTINAVDHIQYRRTVAVDKEYFYYPIDVITEKFLLAYLDIVEQDMKAIEERVEFHSPRLRNTLSEISHKKYLDSLPPEVFRG
jgi:hypothetical protein